MTVTRRMGSVESAKADAMLDAAEEILKEEGYAALTSRRVAEYLDVKQRLVYYYFRTMDDLVLETFKRLSARELARLKAALSSDHPLHEIWKVFINTSDPRLISEFMALANRNEGVREQVIAFIEQTRDMQAAALKRAFAKAKKGPPALKPDVVAFMGASMALSLNREAALGVSKGHAAVKKMINQFFEDIEP